MIRDPWDPAATGEATRLPDGTYAHHREPVWSRDPEPTASDAEYYADRAARREESRYW